MFNWLNGRNRSNNQRKLDITSGPPLSAPLVKLGQNPQLGAQKIPSPMIEVNAQAAENRAKNQIQAIPNVTAQEDPSVQAQISAGSTIRALGGYHEGLRARCETLVSTLELFRSASDETESLFREFGMIALKLQEKTIEFEDISKNYHQEVTLNRAKQIEIDKLIRSRGELEKEINTLTPAKAAMEARSNSLEVQLRKSQTELKDSTLRLKDVERELAIHKSDSRALEQEVDRLTQRLKSLDKAYNDACEERRAAREKLLLETEERLKVVKLNEEANLSLAQAKRNYNDALSEIEQQKLRIAELDSQIQKAQAENNDAQEVLRTNQNAHETSLAAAKMKIEGMNSRLKLMEQLLEKSREEGRNMLDERLAFDETAHRLQATETAMSQMRTEHKQMLTKVGDLEQSRNALIDRAGELLAQVQEKHLLNDQAEARIKSLQDRIFQIEDSHKSEIKIFTDQIRQLSDDLAAERNSKAFIEGALQTARKDRTQLQTKITELKKSEPGKAGASSDEAEHDHHQETEQLTLQIVSGEDNIIALRQP
jgi:crescentin